MWWIVYAATLAGVTAYVGAHPAGSFRHCELKAAQVRSEAWYDATFCTRGKPRLLSAEEFNRGPNLK